MLLDVSGHRMLMRARFNSITPAVLAGGDLYRIHSSFAFHIPPHCCPDDGLNHLCAGERGERGAEPGQSQQGQSF